MQFLKTLFWMIVLLIFILFSIANWSVGASATGKVIIQLWGGLVAEVRLPLLVFVAFLIGFVPTYGLLRLRLATLKRRLNGNAPVRVANAPGRPASSEPAASERSTP